jgi:hypothetical protein|nr:MAG TPA: hypothetical protein [Caudoviricetes sp.]
MAYYLMKIFFHVLLDKVNLFPSIEILTSLVLEQTIETLLFRVSAAVITVYIFVVDGDILLLLNPATTRK